MHACYCKYLCMLLCLCMYVYIYIYISVHMYKLCFFNAECVLYVAFFIGVKAR